jgi:hypothetical protein
VCRPSSLVRWLSERASRWSESMQAWRHAVEKLTRTVSFVVEQKED